jgi:dicarboxylate transporter 10
MAFLIQEKTKKDIVNSWGSAGLAVVATSPLEVIKMNAQVTSSNISIGSMFKDVYKTHHLKGFYKGLGASILAQPGYWTFYWPIYNNLKDKYSVNGQLDFSKKMGIIFASSSIASMIINPFFVFKTRFQTSVMEKNTDGTLRNPNMTYKSLIYDMAKKEGIRGFYKGNLVAQFKNTQMMVQMPLYDYINESGPMNSLFGKSDIILLDKAFLSGVAAKTVASCVLYYPIDSIRTNIRNNVENKSIRTIVKDIYKRPGGLLNFYRGVGIYWISAVPTFGTIMYIYEKLSITS